MGLAAPLGTPDGASGSPIYSPKGNTAFSLAAGIQFNNALDDADRFCFFGRENRWGWSPTIHLVQLFERDGRVAGGDIRSKLDIAVEALHRFSDAVAHLASVETPIIGVEKEARVGRARSLVSGKKDRDSGAANVANGVHRNRLRKRPNKVVER